ncbi:hypothetical protein J2741_000627 [Methanolinea mesophila]|uniref:hypothetical protein n=1 Tax=Methanolinea mesophila TaxID=547055 RepID=UPI001AE82491|nr:hypothetical protein [Methanolinea mesophila]MBP1928080.1 hypothetical protein [Methanolinea mesophila]
MLHVDGACPQRRVDMPGIDPAVFSPEIIPFMFQGVIYSSRISRPAYRGFCHTINSISGGGEQG